MNAAQFMKIHRSGLQSTIQDRGRFGHQREGVPVNGPMDERSHRLANALVGNSNDAATLECTATGPSFEFSRDALIALCGADMHVKADSRSVPMNSAVLVRRGVVIECHARRSGARIYLAIDGGFATEPVLGSRSTNLRGQFGGFHGRALKNLDRVPIRDFLSRTHASKLEDLRLQSGLSFVAAADVSPAAQATDVLMIRCILGPQWMAFNEAARNSFLEASYEVSPQSDRMGFRLSGPPLSLQRPLEMISEVTTFGTIQVPPDGFPIILMADRQTAGGYPKMAYVISADLPILAQSLPGATLRFIAISQSLAEKIWLDSEHQMSNLERAAEKALQ